MLLDSGSQFNMCSLSRLITSQIYAAEAVRDVPPWARGMSDNLTAGVKVPLQRTKLYLVKSIVRPRLWVYFLTVAKVLKCFVVVS